MSQCHIPSCYFPSTVFFVDDSKDFLVNFSLQLDELLAYRLFDSPYEALKALHVNQQPEQLNQRCVSEDLDSLGHPLTSYSLNIDLSAIHWEVYNPQRFSEISVVVVDYAMPGMNGLEFCQRIQNSPVKKILLTGRADEKTAIKAFNSGLIDCFIQKNDPNITQLITENIHRLQRKYFQNMSELIVKMLSVSGLNYLEDRKFSEFFEKVCRQNNIVEYYLMENSGSFLLLDIDSNPTCLIVKNQADLDHYYELAMDHQAPQTIIDHLKSGSMVPYFWQGNSGEFQTEWDDWSTYLHPAKKIECNETYYYALVKNSFAFDIQTDKILSYQEYLDQHDELGSHFKETGQDTQQVVQ